MRWTWPPTTPQASEANVTYVGALSRKLESAPEPQKNSQARVIWMAPDLPISSSRRVAGTIVTKIPMKMTATSMMGPQVNLLEARISFDVVKTDSAAIAAIPETISSFWRSKLQPTFLPK